MEFSLEMELGMINICNIHTELVLWKLVEKYNFI